MRRSWQLCAPCLVVATSLGSVAIAQDALTAERYEQPSANIRSAVLAPWFQNVSLSSVSPTGEYALRIRRDGPPPLAFLARPSVNLAGVQIDTVAGRDRSLFIRGAAGLEIHAFATNTRRAVDFPEGARLGDPTWSPDGRTLAIMVHRPEATHLYTVDPATAAARRVGSVTLMPTLDTQLEWTRDNRILVTIRPDGLAPAPLAPVVAVTPRVQSTDPKNNGLRTYASLLRTPHDAELFAYYATTQLALVSLDGRVEKFGKPAMVDAASVSPAGDAVRVTLVEKPFSYIVPAGLFGRREIIWDREGKELTEISKTPLTNAAREDRPAAPRPDAKRAISWRPDGTGLSYLQQGPENVEKKRNDRVMRAKFPFDDKSAEVIYESPNPITSVRYLTDGRLVLTQTIEGKSVMQLVDPVRKIAPIVLAKDTAAEGTGALLSNADGTVRVTNNRIFWSGTKQPTDPQKFGPQPWIDAQEIGKDDRTRLFEGSVDKFETAQLLAEDRLLVVRQSPTEVPNTFLRTIPGNAETRLTENRDYVPDLSQAVRETIRVRRADGMTFQVRVTMMPGAFKRPAFFWFYPNEYADQAAYNRSLRGFNKNLFSQVSGSNKAIFLRAGYVLVEPDCPIFGARPNDSYVPQLRNNLAATIDALEERGWIDRRRLAIGGHSYGGFSTVNAMIHTPFFKAGIAGAGNYNRTLTPFGFQGETRFLFEGREVYLSMSPILYAEQLSGALLLYHGAEDQNVGTSPINSDRLFAVLESIGKPASLYMYPYEDHGQIARETILDQWARWIAWLDKYTALPKE